jgi:enoyl-CoA hydratase/carnithine racemase
MIEVENKGPALWIVLNRPDALNALHPEMIAGINGALESVHDMPHLRAVVLSGRGRAFSAGADLKYNQSVADLPGGNTAFVRAVSELTIRLEEFDLPVIGALNGLAVAGGLELALGCDLIVAAAGAKLGDMHANYALFPGGGASVRLARRIGAPLAKKLMFFGTSISAEEAQAIGLVDAVVPDDKLIETVDAMVAKLADKSPLVLRRIKAAVNQGLEVPLRHALRWERDLNELHSHSSDRTEGLNAFKEKRPPRFTGR